MIGGLLVAAPKASLSAGGYGVTLASLKAQIDALTGRVAVVETRTAPLSVAGPDFTITGMNVHIVDGTGSTNSNSGLGNLIVGYNALRNLPAFPDIRTGSHNLVLGDANNYASYGGLVAGTNNNLIGPYSSISGGIGNYATGFVSSIGGGADNTNIANL